MLGVGARWWDLEGSGRGWGGGWGGKGVDGAFPEESLQSVSLRVI